MDKLTKYRTLVKQIFQELASLLNRRPTASVESLCVFDEERDQYLLVNIGWAQHRRVRDTTLFVRLREGKIWIEEDWTEHGITKDLLAAGVPKDDIVLAFHPPDLRPLTDFAVT